MVAAAMISAVTGALLESFLIAAGILRYAAGWPIENFAPLWIVMLWLAFGATLKTMNRMLDKLPATAKALLGAILGPLTYLAGAATGALQILQPGWAGMLPIALIWALALPLLSVVIRD